MGQTTQRVLEALSPVDMLPRGPVWRVRTSTCTGWRVLTTLTDLNRAGEFAFAAYFLIIAVSRTRLFLKVFSTISYLCSIQRFICFVMHFFASLFSFPWPHLLPSFSTQEQLTLQMPKIPRSFTKHMFVGGPCSKLGFSRRREQGQFLEARG